MRRKSTHSPLPEYPSDEDNSVGVAVVELIVDADGKVESARILQAPSDRLGLEVVKASRTWTFQRTSNRLGKALRLRGKLTFYFEKTKEGQFLVRSPWPD